MHQTQGFGVPRLSWRPYKEQRVNRENGKWQTHRAIRTLDEFMSLSRRAGFMLTRSHLCARQAPRCVTLDTPLGGVLWTTRTTRSLPRRLGFMTRKPRQDGAQKTSTPARTRGTTTLRIDPESARLLRERLATPQGHALLEELARCYARAAVNRTIEEANRVETSTRES